MASVYQRFSGKINTNTSFPAPPEASHLLGGRVKEEENAGKTPTPCQDPRSRVVHHKRSQCNDEDVSETISLHSQCAFFIRLQSPVALFFGIAAHCWFVTHIWILDKLVFCYSHTCEFSEHISSLALQRPMRNNLCCKNSLLMFVSVP